MFIINKLKLDTKKIITIIIAYLVYVNFFKGYLAFLPTLPVYPNNEKEVELVKEEIKKRRQEDIDFFYMTNKTVAAAFLPHVDESKKELDKIILDMKTKFIVRINKYLINRARPSQVCSSIIPLDTSTAETPSYPAGHAFQAYVLYKKLSNKYPEKEGLLKDIAMRCDDCRIKCGLHYPSDGEYSRRLVEMFY